MLEKALVAYLLANAPVAALVGKRIHALVIPQKSAFPAIRYQRVSTVRPRTKDGPTGDERVRLQVDVYATRFEGATALGRAVHDAIDAFAGVRSGIRIAWTSTEDESHNYEPQAEAGLYRVSLDFFIWNEGAV